MAGVLEVGWMAGVKGWKVNGWVEVNDRGGALRWPRWMIEVA